MSDLNTQEKCPRCGGIIADGAATPDLVCSCASKPKEWIRRTLTREMEREISVDRDKFPLKRYKPLSLIGSGGNGTVYCCRDRLLKKKVAIKIISDATSGHLVAFQKEAKATSKLLHPNIVSILDFGVMEGGTPYMVMEMFEGGALSQVIKTKGPLQIPTALSVFSRVCDGLAEAHRMGVFHRDINSSNILVSDLDSETPAVRIIDFGVARVRQEQDASLRTQGLTLVGTPHYMSPDQAAGKPFDERSEIYSVGCAMFETLTGVPPYSGDSAMEIINQHATAPVPTLSEKNSHVYFPQDLESLVASCLAKDPAQRPQSMAELGNALNNLSITMTLSNPTMRLELAPKKKKDRQKAVLLIVALSGFLLSILFVSTLNVEPKLIAKDKVLTSKHAVAPHRARWTTVIKNGYKTAVPGDIEVGDDDLDQIIGSNCQSVVLNSTDVTNVGLDKMKNMPLKSLNVANTAINDSSVPYLAKFKDLTSLNLRETGVTDYGITGLSSLKSLQQLNLDGLEGVTDNGLETIIAQWPDLQDLDLSNSGVTNSGLLKLNRLKNLKGLSLGRLTLSDDVMRTIIDLNKLEKLGLSEVSFDRKFFDQIPSMPNLKLLMIGCLPGADIAEYSKLRDKLKNTKCDLRMNYDPKITEPTVQPLVELMGAEEAPAKE